MTTEQQEFIELISDKMEDCEATIVDLIDTAKAIEIPSTIKILLISALGDVQSVKRCIEGGT